MGLWLRSGLRNSAMPTATKAKLGGRQGERKGKRRARESKMGSVARTS